MTKFVIFGVISPDFSWCMLDQVGKVEKLNKNKILYPGHSIFCKHTRCMPMRCYGHLIIYKATHKTYNKNFSIEGITSEERLEVERTV
jgi:hypothetical protein